MCDPITALKGASLAISATGSAMQTSASLGALESSARAQAGEISMSQGQAMSERARAARRERARLMVAGGEAGVAGNSLQAALMDSFMQQGIDVGTMRKQTELQQSAMNTRLESAAAQIGSPLTPLMGAGLQIGGMVAEDWTPPWRNRASRNLPNTGG